MHPTVNIAMRAAREAGRIMLRNLNRLDQLNITSKRENDFVSDVDRMAEAEIIRTIRHVFPDHGILAEESGSSGGDEDLWIIDPLDGTTNYLHGFPQFAVSIAYRHRGRLESGVVYDPLREEMFVGSRGHGALLNDRRLRVSDCSALANALLGTGFPFRDPNEAASSLDCLGLMMSRCQDVRRAGAAALDLAYVAAGRLDGFWEARLSPWDIAAGALLIQEAGGLVGDFRGGHEFLFGGDVVAGPPKVFKGMLQTLSSTLGPQKGPS
jgi:myo-inositol-1(or 4)-monophosphatase